MNTLSQQRCSLCQKDTPQVSEEQAAKFMPFIPDWEVVEIDNIQRLTRTFSFNDFLEALAFANKVGALAEEENHHPAILTEWGRVKVSWWTHIIKGLHRNDFIMAAKTDALLLET
jgi:4a-hydroxytetrahydrobiopterin dehydratase